MSRVPQHYVPKYLSKKSKRKAKKELRKSRKAYKQKKYYTRKKIPGYKSKKSKWSGRVKRLYKLDITKGVSVKKLAKATKCTAHALRKIIKKGQGAYYSSGSRPNQTAHSWGYARLYSAVTGGPAARVDKHVLEKGCSKSSKALRLAKRAKKPAKRKKVNLVGGAPMKEVIVKFEKSKNPKKKYTAFVKNKKTQKIRKIHFGASDYQQYKDRTGLGHFSHKNHHTRKRMRNYFNRHSGTPHRTKAIEKEKTKANGYYNAKILSHEYLW